MCDMLKRQTEIAGKERKPSPTQERRLFLFSIVLCDTCDMCDMLKRQTEIAGKERKHSPTQERRLFYFHCSV